MTTAALRCALIGTGAVATLHARAVAAHPRAELIAVADLGRDRADSFAATWGVPAVYDDLGAMLTAEHPDVVLICTPPVVHREQTLAAFAAGAHVIVEKPPAPSLDELDEMRAAAEAAGRELAVVFQQRTGTAAAHVKRLLDDGALGRPLLAQCQTLWFRDADYFAVPWRGKWETEGGGTTLGHGIHQLDLLGHLLGDWTRVEGRLWRVDRETDTEDVSTATVLFASGVVAQVVSSTVSPRETSSIRIDTQKATITVDHLYGHGHDNWQITRAPHVSELEAAEWAFPADEERSDHAPLLRDVFDALLDGTPLPPTADAPARTLELVAAIYASAAADGAVITPGDLAEHPTHRRSFRSPRDRPAPMSGVSPIDPDAPAPREIYRDPIYDGATDPTVVRDAAGRWWMFYTQRRATHPDPGSGVAWVHGSRVGVARSDDGLRWHYVGTLEPDAAGSRDLALRPGTPPTVVDATHWAPDVIHDGSRWRMYLTEIDGIPTRWEGHQRHIVEYVSTDLATWRRRGPLNLASDRVIDAAIARTPDGRWRLWYKDEAADSTTAVAVSDDLESWSLEGTAIAGRPHEGPYVFPLDGAWWMITDEWRGFAVHRSSDALSWVRQGGPDSVILGESGPAPTDVQIARHGAVTVHGGEVRLYYFTHPWWDGSELADAAELSHRRSAVHVARLRVVDGALVADA